MKIVLTGSLGHIGMPLTTALAQRHAVTVISSSLERQSEVEALGASAAIGSLEDEDFLAETFRDANAVYCMVPPNYMGEPGLRAYYRRLGENYVYALQKSGVSRVVHLSSFGAELEEGTGNILGSHDVEGLLNDLPDIALTHMRPTSFYYNLYGFTDMIKAQGMIAANYGGNDSVLMVSPKDIAAAVADELERDAKGTSVRYVASDERTGHEIAHVLGEAIGKPDLQWVMISDAQMQEGLEASGMPEHLAASITEMYSSMRLGRLRQGYDRANASITGKVKLEDFAKEFAAAF